MLEYLAVTFTPFAIFLIVAGTIGGAIVGSIPGLTAPMVVVLLVPFTYSLDPALALMLLGGIYCGTLYGGSIPAILLNAPGTPAAAATAIEGYEMARQGRGALALKLSTISAFVGGISSIIFLLLVGPFVAEHTLKFGPPEIFAMAALGLSTMIAFSQKDSNILKSIVIGLVGLAIALIGTDNISGEARYNAGLVELTNGVNLIAALIGLFSMQQMFEIVSMRKDLSGPVLQKLDLSKKEPVPKGSGKYMAIGATTGITVGVLPGEGSTVAAFTSYQLARYFSSMKSLFGRGNPQGLAASESGKNGCVGGAMIPTLTLGIPGNAVAAALLGAFVIHGIIPGPELFTTYGDRTYPFIYSIFVSNWVFLLFGLLFASHFIRMSVIPIPLFVPIVTACAVLGTYSLSSSMVDVYIMIAFAFSGMILKYLGYSLEVFVLGLILGPIAERGFCQGIIIGQGNWRVFFESGISKAMWILVLVLVLPSFYRSAKAMMRSEKS